MITREFVHLGVDGLHVQITLKIPKKLTIQRHS